MEALPHADLPRSVVPPNPQRKHPLSLDKERYWRRN